MGAMREVGGGRSRNVNTVIIYDILKKLKKKRSTDSMINNIWTITKTSV